MSSTPPTSVPTITSIVASPTPPERSSQKPSEYFPPMSHTSGRVQPPGNNITSPVDLSRSNTSLLTPPISEPQTRKGRDGYFSLQNDGPVTRTNRKTYSDYRSCSTLSPALSSGGSVHSSDTGRSPYSYSSGEYLSPPQFQADDDKPPHLSRRGSSSSLTMVKKKLKRANTIPNDRNIKGKRRHRQHHGCRHHRARVHKEKEDLGWQNSGCQTAPTATVGNKQLCRNHTGHFVPKNTRHGITDTFGRSLLQSIARPLRPDIVRRWSSVEMGAHQISLQSMSPKPLLPGSSTVRPPVDEVHEDRFIPQNLQNRHRSSTFTRGAIDHDIVRVVRERLTLRKIVPDSIDTPVEPPLSITIRRASGASSFSAVSAGLFDPEYHSTEGSGTETPLADSRGQHRDRKPSAAYLLTSKDIESITLLIAENLKQNLQSQQRDTSSDKETLALLTNDEARKATYHNSHSRLLSEESRSKVRTPAFTQDPTHSDYLRVEGLQQPRNKSGSGGSVHEVIWKGSSGSSLSFGSSASDQEDEIQNDTSSEHRSSPDMPSDVTKRKKIKDKGDAFDPHNARESISEWSWKLPQTDLKMSVTSSDSDSVNPNPQTKTNRGQRRPLLRTASSTPKVPTATRVRPYPRYAASHEQLQDVVSFPPLVPRKATSEWFSPLPDMQTMPAALTSSILASRSLYDLGIDVTIGPSGSTNFKPPFTSLFSSAEISPSQSPGSPGVDFRQDYGFGGQSGTDARIDDGRKKSVVKPHPKATARNGQTFAMGSSIGAHSHERRRSSVPRIQRVRTIDNVHKGEHDEPPSRWRKPSICPPRLSVGDISTSPAEAEDPRRQGSEERIPEILTRLSRLRSGISDRITLVEARCPPIPKSDCAGIYGTITGTLRKSIALPCEQDTSRHSCHDCENSPRPSIDWIG